MRQSIFENPICFVTKGPTLSREGLPKGRALEYAYSGCAITWHGTVQSDIDRGSRGRGMGVVSGERRSGIR